MGKCESCAGTVADGERFCVLCSSRSGDTPNAPLRGDLWAPRLPERFEVVRALGRGAMGWVYLCRDRTLGVHVAVKVLPVEIGADDPALVRLRKEAQAAARLRTAAGVLSLYDLLPHEGAWFLVMEYAPGGSLRDRIEKESSLPESDCRRIGAEVADALATAHEAGVLHRDIKPDNVLFDAAGHAKIADFGVARVLSETSSRLSHLTVAGTPLYMAPEILREAPADFRADLYSLGCTLYEAATGKPAFHGVFHEILLQKSRVGVPPPDPRALVPELSEAFSKIVRRLLAPDPDDRYPDAHTVADALRGGAATPRPGGHSTPHKPATAPVADVAAPPKRRVALFATLALLVVSAVAAFALIPGRATTDDVSRVPIDSKQTALTGNLTVTTVPEGAEIFVDGVSRGVAGAGGRRITDLSAGGHDIRAELAGHVTAEQRGFAVDSGVDAGLSLTLRRARGTLRLRGGPPAANVRVTGAGGGVAPHVLDATGALTTLELDTGEYEVVVEKDGFETGVWRAQRIEQDRTLDLPVALRAATATLVVDSVPSGAEVRIDDVLIGTTSQVATLAPGRHVVRLTHPEAQEQVETVDVAAGATRELKVILPMLAILNLRTLPDDVVTTVAGARVEGVVRLPPGNVVIEFSRAGYRTQTVTLTLRQGVPTVPSLGAWSPKPAQIGFSRLPPGARAIVDGTLVLKDPHELAAGPHRVAFRRPGFRRIGPVEIQLAPGEERTLPDPWPAPPAELSPPPRTAGRAAPLPAGFARDADGRIRCEKDGAEMVQIPASEFVMGATQDRADHSPQHEVSVAAFLVDRTEVTNAQFERFVAATGHRTDAEKAEEPADWRHPAGPNASIEGRGQHPVVHVTWNDAKAYATWAGKRLLTEAEFELLLQGPPGSAFHASRVQAAHPWGVGPPKAPCGNYADEPMALPADAKPELIAGYDDGFDDAASVASFPQEPWGTFDVSGNVNEWCHDWYDDDFYGRSPRNQPRGPASGTRGHVARGGSWNSGLTQLRCCDRTVVPTHNERVGFRCAK